MVIGLFLCVVFVVLLISCHLISISRGKQVKAMKISTDNQEFDRCLQEVVSAASFTLIDCRKLMENFGVLEDLKYSLPANANINYDKAITPMQDISPIDLA